MHIYLWNHVLFALGNLLSFIILSAEFCFLCRKIDKLKLNFFFYKVIVQPAVVSEASIPRIQGDWGRRITSSNPAQEVSDQMRPYLKSKKIQEA